MTTKIIGSISLCFAILLMACVPQPIDSIQKQQLEVTSAQSVSPTFRQSASMPYATPTPRPSLNGTVQLLESPSILPDSRLSFKCLEILATPPPDGNLVGTLAIWNLSGGDKYLLNLETGGTSSLGNVYDLVVSPNRKNIAFKDPRNLELVVANVEGKSLTTILADMIQLDIEWDNIPQWLDNNHLLIERQRYDPYDEVFKLPSLIVLNPSTKGQQEFLPEDFPDINDLFDSNMTWSSFSRIVPDETLTRIVYPGLMQGEIPIILWNNSEGKEITRIHSLGPFGNTPKWSPDGSLFVIIAPIRVEGEYGQKFENLPNEPSVGGLELMGVSRDGEIKRLTYLTNVDIAFPSGPAWSPDGHHIAYWLTIEGSDYAGERLAVVDIQKGQVTNYCVPGYPGFGDGQSPPPVWSPDGNYLAVTIPDPQTKFKTDVIIVNLVNNYAFKIEENAKVLGWLTSMSR